MLEPGATQRLKYMKTVLTARISAVLKASKNLAVQLQTEVRKSTNTLKTTSTAHWAKCTSLFISLKARSEELRELYIDAKVELEGEWGFDLDWATVGWMQKETWARIKLDALVQEDETSARVIDYKTGKKFGNEVSHGQQGLLYAIATFFRYPNVQFVQTEFWYLDHGETTKKQYTRAQAMLFAPAYHRRAIKMTTETEFAPTPSKDACRWCSFRKGDNPECTWGVD